MNTTDYIAIGMVLASCGFIYGLAVIGEPQSLWLMQLFGVM